MQIPLYDSDRNSLYDLFESIQDQIGNLIELTAKIKQIDLMQAMKDQLEAAVKK